MDVHQAHPHRPEHEHHLAGGGHRHEDDDGHEDHRSSAGHDHHAHHGHGHPGHEGHGEGGGHGHHGAGATSWRTAAQATAHCLTGCAIGEITGLVIGTALGLSTPVTIALAVALAFVFGYALTMRGVLRAGVGFGRALRVALAADTVSILVMEVVDNGVMLAVPGAMESGLASPVFWASLAFALAVAFVLTTPVNKWLISRGRGHAVVHAYH